MKRVFTLMMAMSLAIATMSAQNEADRAVATFIADMARMSSEKVSFTSMKCDKQMLAQFNIETNDQGLQSMLNSIGRLYMIYSQENTTIQLMRKRMQDLESRGYLNNYTEVKHEGNNVTVYLPALMQMAYIVSTVVTEEKDIILVIADEGFYNLVERLRTE